MFIKKFSIHREKILKCPSENSQFIEKKFSNVCKKILNSLRKILKCLINRVVAFCLGFCFVLKKLAHERKTFARQLIIKYKILLSTKVSSKPLFPDNLR